MTARYISSAKELRVWLDEATCRDDAELDAMTAYIQRQPNCPKWGTDWQEYLKQLDIEKLLRVAR